MDCLLEEVERRSNATCQHLSNVYKIRTSIPASLRGRRSLTGVDPPPGRMGSNGISKRDCASHPPSSSSDEDELPNSSRRCISCARY